MNFLPTGYSFAIVKTYNLILPQYQGWVQNPVFDTVSLEEETSREFLDASKARLLQRKAELKVDIRLLQDEIRVGDKVSEMAMLERFIERIGCIALVSVNASLTLA